MNVLRDSYHLSNHLIIQDVLNARYIINSRHMSIDYHGLSYKKYVFDEKRKMYKR